MGAVSIVSTKSAFWYPSTMIHAVTSPSQSISAILTHEYRSCVLFLN